MKVTWRSWSRSDEDAVCGLHGRFRPSGRGLQPAANAVMCVSVSVSVSVWRFVTGTG